MSDECPSGRGNNDLGSLARAFGGTTRQFYSAALVAAYVLISGSFGQSSNYPTFSLYFLKEERGGNYAEHKACF